MRSHGIFLYFRETPFLLPHAVKMTGWIPQKYTKPEEFQRRTSQAGGTLQEYPLLTFEMSQIAFQSPAGVIVIFDLSCGNICLDQIGIYSEKVDT